METEVKTNDGIDFLVGVEMSLNDILSAPEVDPLLAAIIKGGAELVAITDPKGRFLWAKGDRNGARELQPSVRQDADKGRYENANWRLWPLYHEAEPIGFLFILRPPGESLCHLSHITEMAFTTLNLIMKNSVKRMLTTEVHTASIQQSYNELLEINKKLSISEKKYRHLAQTLEQRVEERTAELKKAHTRLLQQEKMASVGQLAAGVAHEINTPIGFIYSNLNTLLKYMATLIKMLKFYKKSSTVQTAGSLNESEELYNKLKIDFIMDDSLDLIQENIDGAEKIKTIVANLKDFSHIDDVSEIEMNINQELENTISVLLHEIKSRSARIIKKFGRIPSFKGHPGLISQVFFNILLNALQSKDKDLVITVRTEQKMDDLVISIADNGPGIPSDIQGRLFEPFFTTKDVGQGTGMGLSIAYDIVSGHKGNIKVNSQIGEGSNFSIILPLNKKYSPSVEG